VINDLTQGRREVKELTGQYWVPVLVNDDGTVIQGSKKIVCLGQGNPLAGVTNTAAGATAEAD